MGKNQFTTTKFAMEYVMIVANILEIQTNLMGTKVKESKKV